MTTIAYRDGILAADTRLLMGDIIQAGAVSKIIPVINGVAAVAGQFSDLARFIEWACRDPAPGRPNQPDFDASRIIFASPAGLSVFEGTSSFMPQGPFFAWGSGAAAALGAMHAGATAHDAVMIAARIDPATGGGVIAYEVATKSQIATSG